MPAGWPAELTLLLGAVRTCALQRLVDPALTASQALRLFRTANALAQAVLQSLPVMEKKTKPAPNPFARSKAPPPLPRLAAGRNDPTAIANLLPDLSAILETAINGVTGAGP